MPTGLKITLTLDEDQTLKELELAKEAPRRTKHRASVLRLNSRGWTVKAVADYLGWAESTVRQTRKTCSR
jgi:DNA-binding NarL/FixJ family response regulator